MIQGANISISDLIAISIEAGKTILEIYHNKQENWELSFKTDQSPLTLADRESNKVICENLEKLYPEIPIISEENKEIPFEIRSKYNYFWLVDPLDGTKEFIKRNGEFTVNIALVHQNKVIAGVVHVPCLNLTYWAEKGKGAFCDNNGNITKLQVLNFDPSKEGMVVVASRSHMNEETISYINQFKNPETTSMGSSLKLLLVAEGKAHVYPRLGPTMEWDTAASQIIVEEAGGSVLQFENNQAVIYNKVNLLNPYFVVVGCEL